MNTFYGVINRLQLMSIASCTCVTKTPVAEFHADECRYRNIQRTINDLEEIKQKVGDLLATIHRDGGHYTAEHGLEKSLADAINVVCEDRRKLAELS